MGEIGVLLLKVYSLKTPLGEEKTGSKQESFETGYKLYMGILSTNTYTIDPCIAINAALLVRNAPLWIRNVPLWIRDGAQSEGG